MLRDIVLRAWREDPREVVAAVALTPLAVVVGWAILVVAIVAGTPA